MVSSFFEIATDQVPASEIERLFREVIVISFNYDRTLELFLRERLKALYAISDGEASKVASQLKIIRPYGGLGPLPMTPGFGLNAVPFGCNTPDVDLATISQNLKTFNEAVQSTTSDEIVDALQSSSNLVFLGFGFHRQNISLLAKAHFDELNILGTMYRVADPSADAIKARLIDEFWAPKRDSKSRSMRDPRLVNQTCFTFVSDWREVLRG